MMTHEYYIGLMSGTSLDAIDAVLIDFNNPPLRLLQTHAAAIPADLKQSLLDICQPGDNEINRMATLDVSLAKLLAKACQALLKKANLSPTEITAIGCHGQTIRHMPFAATPFTLQIGDPNTLVSETGITTVADFRRRDIALSGQGAPLAPAFHRFLLPNNQTNQWILNIGGIANLTYLPADHTQPVLGFDCGPGNTLLDLWCQQQNQQPYDKNGEWAAQGKCHSQLLNVLLDDDYFSKKPPKSTGREYFNEAWLAQKLKTVALSISPQDIQTTLTELTAKTIADAIFSQDSQATHMWLCGGGIHNQYLVRRLKALCSQQKIDSTAALGIDPDWIEAAAFAWLARQTLQHKPGNLTTVTGAKQPTILGGVYFAN